ncbi:glycosyltransferase family 39 protein [Halobacteriales archaeon Cl-PHB]
MRRSARRVAPTPRQAAAGLAVVAGVAVYLLSTHLFPYHSPNHDAAVYLQQAGMLLDGQLYLHPPVEDAFRPWFFVDSPRGLYSKYAPVVPAIFAVGKLLGAYRLALVAVGAATVWLTYAVVAEVFDRQTALVAAGLLLASPLFLVQAAVFLPYVPTLCLNLLFAWAFLRADRTGDHRLAALAGAAVGLAFFARPYTAVLFALPFVGLALWRLRTLDRAVLVQNGLTATLGLAGVTAALAYNAVVTGDPLTFPYQAFAPADGLGFGRREILGYDRIYTLSLALEAMVQNVLAYVTRWSVAAPFGVVAALGGVVSMARAERWNPRRLALVGLFVTIPLGELYFWGTLNVLGSLSDPGDGLIHLLGPYYHVGLLVPTAAFGAVGLLAAGRRIREGLQRRDSVPRRAVVAVVVVAAAVGGGITVTAAAEPLDSNADVTDNYAQAYEPFGDRQFEDALVFLPTPYGEWLNHPYQPLRNDPGYGGSVVYATSTRELAVADEYPARSIYRYTYRGRWAPTTGVAVTPHLQPVDRVTADRVDVSITAGVPSHTELVSISLANGSAGRAATVTDPGETVRLRARVDNRTATVTAPQIDDSLQAPVDGRDAVDLRVLVDDGGVSTFSYVVTVPVDATGEGVTVLTPHLEVCRSPLRCGGEAAYVPGTHRSGVSLNTTVRQAD